MILGLLLAACSGGSADPPAEETYRVPVALGRVERRDIEVTSQVVGQLMPWRQVAVAPEVGGNVASLRVDLGSAVASGEELFRIDATNYGMALAAAQAQLTRAEAQRRNAETNLARYTGLAQEGVATTREEENWQRDLDVARAEVASARAQLDIAEENRRDCVVRAPIGGVVTRRLIDVGQNLAAGTPALEIADLHRVKMTAEVSERERVALRPGQPVRVVIDALGGEAVSGEIWALGSSADGMTRSFPIEIAIDNSDGRLLAGMIATARLVLERRPGALVVPLGARVETLAGEGVFVVTHARDASGEAEFVPAEFGDRHGEMIEVLSDLAEAQQVVTRGADGLRDGVAVRVDAAPALER